MNTEVDAQFWEKIKGWFSKKSTAETKAQAEAADEEMAEELSQQVLAQTDFKKLKELYDDVKDKVAVLKDLQGEFDVLVEKCKKAMIEFGLDAISKQLVQVGEDGAVAEGEAEDDDEEDEDEDEGLISDEDLADIIEAQVGSYVAAEVNKGLDGIFKQLKAKANEAIKKQAALALA